MTRRLRRPEWSRSLRFRMAALYSVVLFALAAVLVLVLYVGLSSSLEGEPVSKQTRNEAYVQLPDGSLARLVVYDQGAFERKVSSYALQRLRRWSLIALGGLFLASLLVGWVIAGRVLRPIGRITQVANEITGSDLSERIRLEGPDDELKRLADTFDAMLDRIDGAFATQRRFVADASHELRNPLAIVRTNTDLALATDDPTTAEVRRWGTVVLRATDRMTRLVDDMLALARLEAPRPTTERVDLGTLVGEAVDEIAADAGRRGVAVESRDHEAPVVNGDRATLRRALANLLDNALRVAPAGSAVRVVAGRRESWAFVAVADSGPGIAPDEQERVFDRFYRIDPGRARSDGGSGLGLAIARQIAEAHGGTLRLFSTPGDGATFVLWLPAVREPGTPPAVDPIVAAREAARAGA